jgi:hypothetical protein
MVIYEREKSLIACNNLYKEGQAEGAEERKAKEAGAKREPSAADRKVGAVLFVGG